MMPQTFQAPWQVPCGKFSLILDPLNFIFLGAVLVLVLAGAVYAVGYMAAYREKKALWAHVFFYGLLAAALVIILTAGHVMLFLGAWETMTLATFFLIIFHDEDPAVRKAGFVYLMASHIATFGLFLMFFLMSTAAGSMDFHAMAAARFSPALAGTIFALAIFGFGVKAGFIPGHIWLPYAHPVAPSHVSALLSGVTIKMGIYGLCRVIGIVGGFPEWCGYALILIGVVSGVMGVLYALGQHELKKLLAYHSIENIGIIAIGLGLGLLGQAYHLPLLMMLGFGGALLHVVNHALFKGLLFLAAGAVIRRIHTGEIDRLGGLAKVMPVTAVLFLVGALSICGLPFFNGFISEFIIFSGLFQGVLSLGLQGVIFCALAIVALALMGALALSCFCKVYGTVFSGSPREQIADAVVKEPEASAWMMGPMIVLAALCVWIGLAPATMVRLVLEGGIFLGHADMGSIDPERIIVPLAAVNGFAFLFIGLAAGLMGLRRLLHGSRPMPVRSAWACGFTQVTARSQYTASSFARMTMEFMHSILLVRRHGAGVNGFFPGKTHLVSAVGDASETMMFRPLLMRLTDLSRKIDRRRMRYTQIYLMYIFLFLIFLLVWKLK